MALDVNFALDMFQEPPLGVSATLPLYLIRGGGRTRPGTVIMLVVTLTPNVALDT